MFFRSQPAVGLDVGTSVVKAIQLKKAGNNVEVEKFGMAPVFPGGTRSGDLTQARINAIKNALANAQITAKQVVTSVSGESIIVRYLMMPDIPEDELRSALKFEAEEYIPYNIDDVYLDSDVLGRVQDEAGNAKVDILLVASRKDMIHDHAEMIRAAGIQSSMVDVDSFALFNCFELNYQPGHDEVLALVNIGAQVTNINIYADGTTRFSRDIALAGEAITNAIQGRLSIDYAEAEDIKRRDTLLFPSAYGEEPETAGPSDSAFLATIRGTVERMAGDSMQDPSPENQAAQATREVVNSLVLEIRRSLQFYENQQRSRPISRVIIGGGGARLTNLLPFIETELGISVEPFDPLLRITPNGRNLDAIALAENKSSLGVCIGLALRKLGE